MDRDLASVPRWLGWGEGGGEEDAALRTPPPGSPHTPSQAVASTGVLSQGHAAKLRCGVGGSGYESLEKRFEGLSWGQNVCLVCRTSKRIRERCWLSSVQQQLQILEIFKQKKFEQSLGTLLKIVTE